ncbi:glycosyltransferase family 4 protein [Priestia aryabhattai]|uniref:glycosyltransferase family 4 protein n=1 Tax=Priestia aryabhattai TaxID=412384 RepID=UPI0035322F3D
MKTKIIYICEAMGGGVRRHLLDILGNIDVEKYEVYLLYGSSRVDTTFKNSMQGLEKRGIKLVEIPELKREISLIDDFKSAKSIKKWIHKIKPDIVHCHSSKAGAIGRIVSKISGVKKVYYTPHAYSFQIPMISRTKRVIYIGLEKILVSFSKKNIHVSFGEEQNAIDNKILTKEKSVVIFNGTEIIKKKQDTSVGEKSLVVGTVARMDYQKDPWTFIKIAERIIKKRDHVKFVYVGDGPDFDDIHNYVKEKKLQDRIVLEGFQQSPIDFMSNFDIYLSTSLYEGLPYSIIEALSCGLPVVATNVTGNNELVTNNYNGYLFEMKDINDGTNRIEKLLNEEELRRELGLNSFKFHEESFLIEHMLANMYKLYS